LPQTQFLHPGLTQKISETSLLSRVDDGKTTLVDAMLKQSGTFRDDETVKDGMMDLECERGTAYQLKFCEIRVASTQALVKSGKSGHSRNGESINE